MRAHHQPDPRTAILVLLVVNALVMGRNSMTISLICLAIATVALATTGRWRFLAGFLGVEAGWLILFLVLPHLWQNGFVAFLALMGYWMFKLTTAGGIASYLVILVRPGQFVAALRRMRIPIAITVPVIVLLRFIPTVFSEYHAVREAMALRGLSMGWRAWIHPLRFLEFVLVPLLASCTRIADEMTAAGMVRGLGSKQQPTTLSRLGFSGLDALWILIVVGLVASTWWLKDLPAFPGGSS
ncbi:cobalt transport protein [Mobiluncus mulieris 28-1]|uniref:Cobalt transport protein n=2 Tax=Mobiluncus mulieris TaxID=2052 RepID=E0QT71_9ACTO|nr:energy-coupling factor transporter transmembrane component T [Mobiluncus mulieris]EEJ53516.1 cobalt transport protein [Mobiluncus mulieris ATCC 35243]EEZ91456.1 cobalt transport protein [Mobiluncus mulieris 28-1]EFM45197.1 cobalt transport protein [Mobiluncus mulieris ATCC 35239]EFN93930.1 cobalt transport protein [Mobiluncus mulieris FB024-16]MBB5845505.1 energy-coupling factor transport system permease protein [Mobiluncus mulieris]